MSKKRDLVCVVWRNPDCDWPYFTVEKYRAGGWLKLRGADYPDGSSRHDGTVILAHVSEFKSIEVVA